MPQPALIYRILIASPGDCVKERKLVPKIIREWNASHSLHTSAILEPVLWETHARPELGERPQAIINRQLVEVCDILVGVFWTRLGTSTGAAKSGTAEEIEEFRKAGKSVLLYFSSAPVAPESIDHEQYQALKEYRDQLQASGLCFCYDSLPDLRNLFQGHLAGLMAHTHKGGAIPNPLGAEKESDLHYFESSFSSFLRRFKHDWNSERDSDPTGTNDAKMILRAATDEIIRFRTMIIDGMDDVTKQLDSISRELKNLQRHQLHGDGGKSWKEFWNRGNMLLIELETVAKAVKAAAMEDAAVVKFSSE